MPAKSSKRRWSGKVTRESKALDLARDVFTWDNAKRIARSLKTSAERSTRRKADPFRSAMSMLVFYINRAGKNLEERRRMVLEHAKEELRAQFGKPGSKRKPAARRTARPGAAKRSQVGAATRATLAARTRGKKATAKTRRAAQAARTTSAKSPRSRKSATRSSRD